MFNLLKGFLRGRYRALRKFLLNRSKLARVFFIDKNYAASTSEYCYNVWMKHYEQWMTYNDAPPEVILEIGSGNSLGVGITALLTGSSKFYALEQTQFWNVSTNLEIFDELVQRLREERLLAISSEDHIQAIRTELETPYNQNNQFVHCKIPWKPNDIPEQSIDLICSHTVLQHVMKLGVLYSTMKKWIKPGGYMSHTIDFSSMNTSKFWNGHWTYENYEWKMVTGGTSLINRAALSKHLEFLKSNRFKIEFKNLVRRKSKLKRRDLAKAFQSLSKKDITTSGLYYFAKSN